MFGTVRLIVDKEGRQISYSKESLYHPEFFTLEYLEEYFNEGMDLKLDPESASDAEVLITFVPRHYESNNYLDPVEYDFDLDIFNVIVLRQDYKNSRWLEIEKIANQFGKCSEPIDEVIRFVADWEEVYDEDYYEFKPTYPERVLFDFSDGWHTAPKLQCIDSEA